MQTLKILIVAGILALSFYSCEDDPPDRIIIDPNPPDATLDGAFYLDMQEKLVSDYGPSTTLKVTITGEGDMNEFGQSHLEMSHLKHVDFIKNDTRIVQGSITIIDKFGEEINGIYNVWDFNTQGYQNIDVSIKGGTGRFRGTYGTAKIILTSQGPNKWRAGLKGSIFYGNESTL